MSLARAMITDPRILMLDEATSSIDAATEARVQRGLERLMAGRTSLVIAHRLSTIRGADRVVVLEAGRIVEQGSPAELRAAGGHYAKLQAESERLALTLTWRMLDAAGPGRTDLSPGRCDDARRVQALVANVTQP